jgi:hypothetical protein
VALPSWVAAGTFAVGLSAVAPGLPAVWQENDIFLLFVESNNG